MKARQRREGENNGVLPGARRAHRSRSQIIHPLPFIIFHLPSPPSPLGSRSFNDLPSLVMKGRRQNNQHDDDSGSSITYAR